MNIKAKNLAPPEEQPIDISDEWPEGEVDEAIPPVSPPEKKKATTMKVIVWVCLLNGLAWVWCSYILGCSSRRLTTSALTFRV